MGEIVEQANFWNQNISPILGFDPAFVDWLNICDENEPTRELGQEPPFNIGEDGLQDVPSHSFSIQEDPYEENKINKGRCYAGVFDPDNSLLPLFADVAANFAPIFVGAGAKPYENPEEIGLPKGAYKPLIGEDVSPAALLSEGQIAEYLAYGLGIDIENNEKKVYLLKKTSATAYTFKNDILIETKSYKADEFDPRIWYCQGERGERKRIGFTQETNDQIQESYENLTYVITKYDHTRDLAREILSSNLFFLDNVSHSPERGTTLYFD